MKRYVAWGVFPCLVLLLAGCVLHQTADRDLPGYPSGAGLALGETIAQNSMLIGSSPIVRSGLYLYGPFNNGHDSQAVIQMKIDSVGRVVVIRVVAPIEDGKEAQAILSQDWCVHLLPGDQRRTGQTSGDGMQRIVYQSASLEKAFPKTGGAMQLIEITHSGRLSECVASMKGQSDV